MKGEILLEADQASLGGPRVNDRESGGLWWREGRFESIASPAVKWTALCCREVSTAWPAAQNQAHSGLEWVPD